MSEITRKMCPYCIWCVRSPLANMAFCEWHKKYLLEIYWESKITRCDHYETWHEEI
ncbi:MAG: hypothetical protein IKJ58_10905 [Akkermansia sp.]|nr:hypothetical protein [Akkermansia sp.]